MVAASQPGMVYDEDARERALPEGAGVSTSIPWYAADPPVSSTRRGATSYRLILPALVRARHHSGHRVRIEVFDPALDAIIDRDAKVEVLAEGGDLGVVPEGTFDYGASLESPLWWPEPGYLLFSDVASDRVLKWSSEEGVTVHRSPAGHPNGLARDLQGRLLLCEHAGRQVSRVEPDDSLTVVMRSYRGRRLLRPNTVIVNSDGFIFFTDYAFRIRERADWDVDFEGIYRVSPDLGSRELVIRDLTAPHKLLFSLDEKVLYVGQREGILAFDVIDPNSNSSPGRPDLASRRWVWKCGAHGSTSPDGIKLDVRGNFYIGGRSGIWFVSPEGRLLGHLVTGLSTPNLGFGGHDGRSLFFVGNHALYRVPVKIAGAAARPGVTVGSPHP